MPLNGAVSNRRMANPSSQQQQQHALKAAFELMNSHGFKKKHFLEND
jgi:hypothetical protein